MGAEVKNQYSVRPATRTKTAVAESFLKSGSVPLNNANFVLSLESKMPDLRSSFEILEELGRLSAALRHEAPPLTPSDRTLGRLKATVAELSQPKKAREAKCPPDYVQLWDTLGAFRSSK